MNTVLATVPCDSATCHELPWHTWLSWHNFPARAACWEGGHCTSTPLKNTAGSFYLNTDLRLRHAQVHTTPECLQPLEPLHSSHGSDRLILDKIQWPHSSINNIMETTTSTIDVENVSEIITEGKSSPCICFKRSSTGNSVVVEKNPAARPWYPRLELLLQFFIMFSI